MRGEMLLKTSSVPSKSALRGPESPEPRERGPHGEIASSLEREVHGEGSAGTARRMQ